MSRETRLLATTIVVSLAVLIVLARFRFPDTSVAAGAASPVQPLARLAARAAFDDLSLAVRELTNRVEPLLLVARVVLPAVRAGDTASPVEGTTMRLVPALRVRDDAALVAVPEGARIDGIVGVPGAITVPGRDPVRGFALVRIPSQTVPALDIRPGLVPLTTPTYVAVAEASATGTSLRPLYVGRSDGLGDPRWDVPLFTMGRGAASDVGAPVFMIDGRLAGVLTSSDGEAALVPAETLLTLVDQLQRGTVVSSGDIGVATQVVDGALAAATGVGAGAAVAAVHPDGPAAAVLQPGDVVTAVNGQAIRTPDAFRLRVSRAPAGAVLALTVRRNGDYVTLPVTVRDRPVTPSTTPAAVTALPAADPRPLGLALRPAAQAGSEVVRVDARSSAEAAGLRTGDVIVSAGRRRTPSPAEITSAFAALGPADTLFLSVEREGQPRLVALRR